LESILLFALINLALYVLPISAMVYGVRRKRRDPRGGRLWIIIGAAPFMYYAYLSVTERIAVYWRAHQVAGWSRKPVTRETLPKTIVVSRDAGLAKGWSEQTVRKSLRPARAPTMARSTSGCLVQIVHRTRIAHDTGRDCHCKSMCFGRDVAAPGPGPNRTSSSSWTPILPHAGGGSTSTVL